MSQPRAPDLHHCGGQISNHAVDHLYLCDQHTVNHYFHSVDYAEGEFNPLLMANLSIYATVVTFTVCRYCDMTALSFLALTC